MACESYLSILPNLWHPVFFFPFYKMIPVTPPALFFIRMPPFLLSKPTSSFSTLFSSAQWWLMFVFLRLMYFPSPGDGLHSLSFLFSIFSLNPMFSFRSIYPVFLRFMVSSHQFSCFTFSFFFLMADLNLYVVSNLRLVHI